MDDGLSDRNKVRVTNFISIAAGQNDYERLIWIAVYHFTQQLDHASISFTAFDPNGAIGTGRTPAKFS